MSGSFRGSTERKSVPEKEGIAIVEATFRMDYLTASRLTLIYNNHVKPLVYIYDPYGQNLGIARHTANKLMRWAVNLSAFHYIIERVPRENYTWVDMLSRWAVEPKKTVESFNSGRVRALMVTPINPTIDEELDWPSRKAIIEVSPKESLEAREAFEICFRPNTDPRAGQATA